MNDIPKAFTINYMGPQDPDSVAKAQKYLDENQNLLKQFKEEIYLRDKEIDPDETHDWFSLTYGWALAKNKSPEESLEFARFAIYYTDMA